jgi:hypothetical protein
MIEAIQYNNYFFLILATLVGMYFLQLPRHPVQVNEQHSIQISYACGYIQVYIQ